MTDTDTFIAELESKTKELQKALQFAQRAFVIEFAGTPKSGKTTAVEAIRHFFSRNAFRVHVLVERASVCPIPMKGHLFFNTWCLSTMLAELLANVDTQTDLIIVDRGIFDALVWLNLQEQRSEITSNDARVVEAFLLLDRWRSLIDLVVVTTVNPSKALERETSQRISKKTGSIMNPKVLEGLVTAVDRTYDTYKNKFPYVHKHNSTDVPDIRRSNANIAQKIVERFTEFADPEILVVPTKSLEQLPHFENGSFTSDGLSALDELLTNSGRYVRRSLAEGDHSLTQIIACGLLGYGNEFFVFERKERDPKAELYGKATIWQGTHVSKFLGKSNSDAVLEALQDRVARSLYLSRNFSVQPIGYCWDFEKKERHFGVIFRIEINNEHTASDLRRKEFRRGRGHSVAGQFVNADDLRQEQNFSVLEKWSQTILSQAKVSK